MSDCRKGLVLNLNFAKMLKLALLFAASASAGILALLVALELAPRPNLEDEAGFGKIVEDARGDILRIRLNGEDKCRLPVTLDRIAPAATEALLFYEDRHFYSHPGVNPFSLARAALQSLAGRRRFGASTITMQVARMRYRLDTSSITGKLRQMWLALLLEKHYSKQDILEAYFNLAPYGGNIEGIEAAARIYFHKAASQLTPMECRALAVVPQNPPRRNPAGGKDFEKARARLESVFSQNANVRLKVYGPQQMPFGAPHLAGELLDRPGNAPIRSSLQSDLQEMAEKSLRNYVRRRAREDIHNGAVLLVDARSMEVCALAGSAGFFHNGIFGQVDGTRARRSPGSTLKPFIYALALEHGLIHPHTMLPDSPRSFGGYDPENFDRGFRGPVPAHEALKASRNLPAILLAEQLPQPGLYGFLRQAEAALPRGPEHYGLALALGGAEMTMRELAALYAMLANQGLWRPLRYALDDPAARPKRLLSPESAWLALWMLARPEARAGQAPVFYKTGTSNGMRDAWTAGVIGDYVLVVWIGNFDNSANPYFVGAEAALPLFSELASGLAARRRIVDRHREQEEGLNLACVGVCESTGDIGQEHCERKGETIIVPGVSPVRDSGVIRPVLVEKASGLRACEEKTGETETVWLEFWPSEMRRIFARAGIYKPLPPEWSPMCQKENIRQLAAPPKILLPKKNVEYQKKLSQNNFELPLLASADPDGGKIHWYAGKNYIGSARPGETIFWRPEHAGNFQIQAVDEAGGSASVECRIRAVP